jgi:hypothetical protein
MGRRRNGGADQELSVTTQNRCAMKQIHSALIPDCRSVRVSPQGAARLRVAFGYGLEIARRTFLFYSRLTGVPPCRLAVIPILPLACGHRCPRTRLTARLSANRSVVGLALGAGGSLTWVRGFRAERQTRRSVPRLRNRSEHPRKSSTRELPARQPCAARRRARS